MEGRLEKTLKVYASMGDPNPVGAVFDSSLCGQHFGRKDPPSLTDRALIKGFAVILGRAAVAEGATHYQMQNGKVFREKYNRTFTAKPVPTEALEYFEQGLQESGLLKHDRPKNPTAS